MDADLAGMKNLGIAEPEPVTVVTFSCDTSDTHTGPQTCKLLTIAPELRNVIYELALFEPNAGLVDLLSAGSPSGNLLSTCRQVMDEAKGIYAEAYRRYWSETNFVLRTIGRRIVSRDLPVNFTERDLAQIRHLQFSTTFGKMGYLDHVTLPAHYTRKLCLRLPTFV
ncbi:hypothetical protein LTS10_009028 [Elasticomyces elasticus]|nr:hypothetical protein LTS10_009028 [Elasticomyces elasticus]